jgi:uncharacterized protein YycO
LGGDFVLIHGEGWISWFIYGMQWLRFHGADRVYNHWSHVALVTSGAGRIVEVGPRGVVAQSLEKYRRWEYHYVHVDAPEAARRDAVRLAESCVGQPYGTLSFLGLGVAALVGGRLTGRDRGQQSCAALVARALAQATGATFPHGPPDMMPGDLAKHYGITP